MPKMKRICFISNSGWAIYNFRIELIEFLSQNNFEIECVTNEDRFSGLINKKTYPIMGHPHSLNLFQELISLLKLASLLSKQNYDLLMVYTVRACIEVACINIFSKTPLVLNITGLGILARKESSFLRKILIFISRYFFKSKQIKKIVFQSANDRDFFINNKICEFQKTMLVPGSGVSIGTYKSIEDYPDKSLSFLHMSRLLKSKGVIEYCESAKIVKKSFKSNFILAGDLEEKDRDAVDPSYIFKKVKDKTVEYIGFISDISEILENVDVVVLLTTYPEGIPRSLIESAAAGKIIICSNHPGCKEVVKNGYNGFIIEANTHSLVSAIKKINQLSPEERKIMSENSYKIASNKFDIRIVNNLYRNAIKDITNVY